MKIKSITLYNFRGIKNLCLSLGENITVIAAANGVGKTTILEALYITLSWLTARIKNDNGKGRHIHEYDIKNGAKYAKLLITTTSGSWLLTQYRKATKRIEKSDLTQLSNIVNKIRHQLETDNIIPVIAYYSVHRAVFDISLRIKTKQTLEPIAIYDESSSHSKKFQDNFLSFFEWFREREDIENETYRNTLKPLSTQPTEFEFHDKQLQAVRIALQKFLPEYKELKIKRQPLRMVVIKEDEELRIDMLSAGEKCFIALVGDIARRLAMANPQHTYPLEGQGIILIDEIDLHLHPAWQRKTITKLNEVFPNVQFVVTTHSPQILSEVSPHEIRLLSHEKEEIKYTIPNQSFGLNSTQILQELMGDSGINISVSQNLDAIANFIENDKFIEAKQLIKELKEKLHGTIPDIVEAEATIAMLEPNSIEEE